MYILGINSYHPDSSACILKDGKLITAVEEERFTRIKHFSGFPKNSIKHCLKISNIKLQDVDFITINRDPKANNLNRILYVLFQRPSLKLIINRFKNRRKYQTIKEILNKEFKNEQFQGEIVNVEHHMAHLSSSFNVSPFDEACLISVDGLVILLVQHGDMVKMITLRLIKKFISTFFRCILSIFNTVSRF